MNDDETPREPDATSVPDGPASPLDSLERVQETSLERLKGDGADRALLVRLLETSCLLELSKLGTARLDLATYLQLAVDVIAQFFPVEGCALELAPDGLAPVQVWSGTRVDPTTAIQHFDLYVAGETVGWLAIGPMTADLGPTTFFTAAAEQLSAGVAAVAEAEILRRRAAQANAQRAASSLEDNDPESGLAELVDAVAALPGATAAMLEIDHPAVGPPLDLRAGYWDNDGLSRPITTRERPGVTLSIRWASDQDEGDAQHLDRLLDLLAASLARVNRHRRLREENETDPLTGLGNRRRLARSLELALGRAGRYGERVALLLADLDGFKKVNDSLGHDVGDAVLVAAANAMRATIRSYDEVVRLGGEEFVVLSPACDAVGGLKLAERIRAEVPLQCAEELPRGWRQTISVGVAVYPDVAEDAEALIKRADEAMYKAKRNGRNAVALSLPGQDEPVAEHEGTSWLDLLDEPESSDEPTEPDRPRRLRSLARRLRRA